MTELEIDAIMDLHCGRAKGNFRCASCLSDVEVVDAVFIEEAPTSPLHTSCREKVLQELALIEAGGSLEYREPKANAPEHTPTSVQILEIPVDPDGEGYPIKLTLPFVIMTKVTNENCNAKLQEIFKNFFSDMLFACSRATFKFTPEAGLQIHGFVSPQTTSAKSPVN